MREIDDVVRRALRATGEEYRPADVAAARERFLRRARRRRAYYYGAAALGTAAAIVLGLVLFDSGPPADPDRADIAGPQGVRISAVIDVGASPDSVAVGDEVWVANAGSHTVSRIDPRSNEATSIELPGGFEPEDVVASSDLVWVSDATSGAVQRIDASTGDLRGDPIEVPGAAGSSLDLAVDGEALWAVSPSVGLYRIDASSGSVAQVPLSSQAPTDATIGAGYLWVLDPSGKTLSQIDTNVGGDEINDFVVESLSGEGSADLAVGGGWLWVADTGSHEVLRISPEVGNVTASVSFTGGYAGIDGGERGLWVVTGGASGQGSLALIDTDSGAEVGRRLALAGEPWDVAAGAGAVWVTNRSDGTVTRVEHPSGAPESPEEGAPEVAAEGDDLVYVYSSGGDIFAKEADKDVRTLVATAAPEINPTFTDDPNVIVFERVEGDVTSLVTQDLTTGAESAFSGPTGVEQSVADTAPEDLALGPDGLMAWEATEVDGAGPGEARIVIAGSQGVTSFGVGNPNLDAPPDVAHLEWDASTERLYFEAGVEARSLYYVDVARSGTDIEASAPSPLAAPERGAAYLAPVSSGPGVVEVVRVCCRIQGSAYSSAELGRLTIGAGGALGYEKLVGLDDLGFRPDRPELTLAPAGFLDVEGVLRSDPLWTLGSEASWIVGDGVFLYLVDEAGEVDRLAPQGVGGAAVNPALCCGQ